MAYLIIKIDQTVHTLFQTSKTEVDEGSEEVFMLPGLKLSCVCAAL